jgi:cobalt-zinc-cadmium efflux system outer membrane protein
MALAASGAAQPLDPAAYVALVLRSHPRVAQARAARELAAAERRAALAWPDPVVTADRGQGAGIPLNETAPQWGYAVTQTIPWPMARDARGRAFTRAEEAVSAVEEEALWELELTARESFAALRVARRRADVARLLADGSAEVARLTNLRVDVGEAREADRQRAAVAVARAKADARAAESERAAAEQWVRALAVEPLPEPLELAAGRPPSAELIEALRPAVTERSPRLRAGRAAVARDESLAHAARAARGPEFDIGHVRTRDIDQRSWSFLVSVRVPLWNGGRPEAARAEAAAGLTRAAFQRERLEATLEFEAAARRFEAALDRARAVEGEAVPAAREAARLVRIAYESGEVSLLEWLDAERGWRETEREAADLTLEIDRALLALASVAGPAVFGRVTR